MGAAVAIDTASPDARIAILEEALAECIEWIRRQDIFDDNIDGAFPWVENGEIRVQPPIPGDRYTDAAGLQRAVDEALALETRLRALFSTEAWEAALARSRRRQRRHPD